MNDFQRTLQSSIHFEGVGLHTGSNIQMTVEPGMPGEGIVFVRADKQPPVSIRVSPSKVSDTLMATKISDQNTSISTIEHLMAAFGLLHIDNAVVKVFGPEVPVMDGSAQPFIEAIERVGMVTQLSGRSYLRIKKSFEVKNQGKWAHIEPCSRFEIVSSIEWDHPCIGYQQFHYVEGETAISEIAPARTFGFLHEVQKLQAMGLARGGSLENAVVLNEGLVLNPDGLRFNDEFVRHKVLDAIGDFKVAGLGIQGKFSLHRSGHELHKQILQTLFADTSLFEIITPVRESRSSMGSASASVVVPAIEEALRVARASRAFGSVS